MSMPTFYRNKSWKKSKYIFFYHSLWIGVRYSGRGEITYSPEFQELHTSNGVCREQHEIYITNHSGLIYHMYVDALVRSKCVINFVLKRYLLF